MNKVRASITLVVLLGAGLASFAGCTADKPPPDNNKGGSGGAGGSGGGIPVNCGDGKLDTDEACDDGNNTDADGCTACKVDTCYECSAVADALSTCSPAMAGSASTCDAGKVCDAAGKCVECIDDKQCGTGYCYMNACAKCDDTMKNGDETDVDCGGTHCGKCAISNGCSVSDDCTSTFCADGVCCDDICDGACNSCALAGSLGACSVIEKYGEDTSYGAGLSCTAAAGQACTGATACAKAVGQTCTANNQCASNKCAIPTGAVDKICVKNVGEPCTMNLECASNMCDTAGTKLCL
jgi:hypothetical protein